MNDSPTSKQVPSLGAFSISLPVEDLSASTTFYEKLGFTAMGGDGESWTILSNSSAIIGLFQGMFEKPMLTFNPGWDQDGSEVSEFTDVRDLRRTLSSANDSISADSTGDSESGPASFVITDPDGNPILIDQHR